MIYRVSTVTIFVISFKLTSNQIKVNQAIINCIVWILDNILRIT